MLTSSQIALIKSSAPAIKAHGLEITTLMYSRMLAEHPELCNLFNLSHQAAGTQQKTLAQALAAYAAHIDALENLSGAVRFIAERHAALCVKPEHYQIVGKCLLAAAEKVLGDAATPELIAAWAAAYQQLADILIAAEAGIYKEKAQMEGGWSGWRTFDCVNRVEECPGVVSFYFMPADGGQVPDYKAGEYVTLRVYVPGLQVLQPRQYTLSQAKGSGMLRITVKAIRAKDGAPAGVVSNQLVNTLKVGNQVELTAPTGTFVIDDVKDDHPLVLIAAGIGITPMVAMLEELSTENPLRSVHFLYSTQNKAAYPLRDTVDAVMKGLPRGAKAVFFTKPGPDDHLGQDFDASGRITPASIRNFCQDPDADFYICGPASFMQDITAALRQIGVIEPRIHTESFGA
ncbi:NO-inducible flavohemoprotein [Sutterella faecalis]|uniref:nitric oxide dioxygenase n=2 Tax=Sutterella TaxID=40544 RepID=A0AAI9SBV7_9BURK|nr:MULTISPECIES: NO-inducible flavohemoprotein [Sutterella]KAB7649966.1 NO-inducible flavohemoprotein [Sutterella seckii]QDA55495.1 NO-inducible flavohemoprotein [Sutterella faecalis]